MYRIFVSGSGAGFARFLVDGKGHGFLKDSYCPFDVDFER
jgi:hypothetical protein